MKKLITTILITFLAICVIQAHALTVFDPTNYGQNIANYVRQAEQLYQQVQQTATQLQQLEAMAQNLKNMDASLQQQVMSGIQNNLNVLKNIQSQSMGMTYNYGQLSTAFDQMYPGFASYNGGLSAEQYSYQIQKWQNQTHYAMHDSMKAQGLADPAKIQSEAEMLNTLISASQIAEGALAAAQTGNQIAGFQAQQLMEQKSIMAAGYRAQASYYEQQVQQQEATKARAEQSMSDWGKNPGKRKPVDVMNFGK